MVHPNCTCRQPSGNKELAYALICSVYGIGKTTAFKICVDTALDPHKCLGSNQLKMFKRILEKGCNSVPLLIVVAFLKWLWAILNMMKCSMILGIRLNSLLCNACTFGKSRVSRGTQVLCVHH